ncbi:unnamed protein product [Alternaria alternata]|jgi:hypothetical protein|uniref:Essential protein Yae1 N-terminal domain-containing protein n=1 Tax=Alternaria tenuissima TaxID=119927 RepID=A0A4Q4NZT0_9PLEO|nr:hypothetical protein AA0115_g9099 [Alternaria tenuissima]RYN39455.1 hypothetical protein AA0114_g11296 [Alternaria tenuissima]RYN50609.1 hypothetical protein AA0118_g10791 [Alternaria tenuissima]RYN88108.1 hypothetical protein AA0119_g12164 [Alternaria tenuissima]RYO04805.1 hypothetical protein AA0121_g12698 [Alternaria tenuissima]
MASETDPFDDILTLEDTLYTAAYDLGASDGAHAGRIEGRIFGLEKGFEKFAELGHLHGRSVIWASRLPSLVPNNAKGADEKTEPENKTLPLLSKNERLKNNTTLLHSLTDPETFDTANTEEAVADFDDRFKRAGAKAKVIERIVGETDDTLSSKSPDGSPAPAGRKSKTGPVRVTGQSKTAGGNAKKGDDSMEDFAGSKLLR